LPAAWLLKRVRRFGVKRLPTCRKALLRIGVFPILDHYYEPSFRHDRGVSNGMRVRHLPAIDWNVDGQLEFLRQLTFSDELLAIPSQRSDRLTFHFNNGMFESGDAEYWYQVIRALKPRRICEIGGGNSTLLAVSAIAKNKEDEHGYSCQHVCIEPFEAPWLEATEATILRKRVEDVPLEYFSALESNDILFIDSSHVIKPRGDVLFEFLEILPSLNKGVVVHVHDIFSPRDYLRRWLEDEVLFWNEQYLLEAFLSNNACWRVLGALNYLHHNHYNALANIAPTLTPAREPGSFYIQKIR
jgi:hypothetical protein